MGKRGGQVIRGRPRRGTDQGIEDGWADTVFMWGFAALFTALGVVLIGLLAWYLWEALLAAFDHPLQAALIGAAAIPFLALTAVVKRILDRWGP